MRRATCLLLHLPGPLGRMTLALPLFGFWTLDVLRAYGQLVTRVGRSAGSGCDAMRCDAMDRGWRWWWMCGREEEEEELVVVVESSRDHELTRDQGTKEIGSTQTTPTHAPGPRPQAPHPHRSAGWLVLSTVPYRVQPCAGQGACLHPAGLSPAAESTQPCAPSPIQLTGPSWASRARRRWDGSPSRNGSHDAISSASPLPART